MGRELELHIHFWGARGVTVELDVVDHIEFDQEGIYDGTTLISYYSADRGGYILENDPNTVYDTISVTP